MAIRDWSQHGERGSSMVASLLGGAAALIIAIMVVRVSCALLITIRAQALAERAALFVASHLDAGPASVEGAADRLLLQGVRIVPGTLEWSVQGDAVSVGFRTAPSPLLGLGELRIYASALVN